MRTGLIFDDRYRLDERIAAGGVGQVWLARDLLLERAVAVKVLRPEYADHPETLDRFRKEALHAGAISHPNVAQVYDYGAAGLDGSPYLVMEYVDGSSLADLIAADPLDPVRALDIIAQAADGLSAAHRAGLVHRDVKPGNILITSGGLVKVTDFGIAHAAGQVPVTGPGLVMGTTQYMAPERISGKQGTPASDLYALGIVLHECLTGVPPHDGSPAEVMAAHLYLPLPPLPSGTPTEIEDLVAGLTVKDPARRISDARELAERAAALRDSLRRVPPTRTPSAYSAAQSGPIAFAAEPAPVPVPAPAPALSGALAIADRGPARPDEWTTPGRTAPPTNPPTAARADRPGPPPSPRQSRRREKRRQKAGVLAAGAAIVACAVFAALLMSGAFNEAPAANQAPAAPANGTPTPGTVPTQSPSATASAGGVTHSAATPSAMVGQPATGGNQSAAGSSARPASGSPTAGSSGTGSSTTGSSTTGSSTTGSSTTGAPVSAAPASTVPAQASASQAPATPSSAPATPAGSTPTPTSGSSVCILVICL